MSSVCNKFAKCDDVIVNFCVRSQTIVKLKEFKENVEESQNIVLTDEQAKTLFHQWLGNVYATMDGQQAYVDNDIDSDNDMDYLMEVFWQNTVGDNLEIPKDWEVAKCQAYTTECNKISVGTYGDDKTPLCEEHKVLANYDDDGNLKPEPFDGCEHPSPEVKEVAIVSNKPEVIDFFAGKTVRDAEIEALKAENAQLKERIKQVVKHFEQILSAVIN
jgi:hypothetical protein